MTYLADSNLICEPTKANPCERACEWLASHDGEIAIDAIVLGEIWDGIASLPDGRKKEALENWFQTLRSAVVCLSWTDATAVIWGTLRQEIRKRGFTVPLKDTMIAASAQLHGLTVATRNVTDFVRCGVPVVNPFAPQPGE
jgi:predicted nucleic acid-binding protein